MIIEITKDTDYVHAMGHRVALGQGGETELKRRCYEGLSRLNAPPDEVRFERLWETWADKASSRASARPSVKPPIVVIAEPPLIEPEPPEPAPLPSEPPPEPHPQSEPPSEQPLTQPDVVPALPLARPAAPRSHKKRA